MDGTILAIYPGLNLLLLLLLLLLIFIHVIDNHIPEENHVSRVYNVSVTPWLQFIIYMMLLYHDKCFVPVCYTSRSMDAVPSMAVFCSSVTSCFPSTLLQIFSQ
jgi:hypothetical protein